MMKYIFVPIVFFLVGCGEVFTGYSGVLGKYDKVYSQNSCQDTLIDEKIKDADDELMWNELGGSFKRNCQDYQTSNKYFDKAEDLYKKEVDLENLAQKGIKSVGTILTNDNLIAYKGNVYEAIMLNTYKGLNFMSIGDFNNARVEFNRALDRQRRAKDKFQKDISKKQKKLEKENQQNFKAANNPQTTNTIYQNYNKSIFAGFQAYPDFINPFTTYMSGLFFIAAKDYNKARYLLKESIAMQPNNAMLKSEYDLLLNMIKRPNSKDKYIWLIYENGKSMMKDEFRLDIPLFIVSNKTLYTGIALPTLKSQPSSYEYLSINNQKTQIISNMDRVIKTEFKKKLPFIVTEAVLRTVAKTIAQSQVSGQNEIAGIVFALYNAATNKADVRSWVSLPKNFQALRIKNDGLKKEIKSNSGVVLENLFIPKNKNAIIYINSPVKGNHVSHIITF